MIKKNIILGALVIVLVGVTAGVLGFYVRDIFFLREKKIIETDEKGSTSIQGSDQMGKIETSLQKIETPTINNDWESIKKQLDTNYPNAEHIERGWIQWREPKDLGDLGWTDKEMYAGFFGTKSMKDPVTGEMSDFDSNGIKYIEVGSVTRGRYAGSKIGIFFTAAGPAEPRSPAMYYMIRGDSENRILLAMTEESSRKYARNDLLSYVHGVVFDEETVLDEIAMYPKEIRGRDERELFQKEEYGGNFFLSTEKLTRVFSDSVFGQVWMGEKETKYPVTEQDALALKLNTFSYFDQENKAVPYQSGTSAEGGFYLRRPDGTAVVYRQKTDIFDIFDRLGILQVTWNDGTKNTEFYEEYPSGCGMTSYVYDVTDSVSIERDLIVVGKTEQGDSIYGYKETTHPEFQKLYNEIYWVKEGQMKVSPEEFLNEHPEVFWKNSFGRILAFYNTRFISPAECGKPVIYLYPEKTMDVLIKVFPSEFTKTDPEYGDGWKVTADPSGLLTNKADGKIYPYLFWEGHSNVPYKRSDRGFIVAQRNLKSFFDEKLIQLGLINTEISDFEEFWLPIMQEEKKPFYFITFLSKAQIDILTPLQINPKPDTIIRVMMDYSGLDTPEKVIPQILTTPKRKGFVSVEWGGMLHR